MSSASLLQLLMISTICCWRLGARVLALDPAVSLARLPRTTWIDCISRAMAARSAGASLNSRTNVVKVHDALEMVVMSVMQLTEMESGSMVAVAVVAASEEEFALVIKAQVSDAG
jgi:hypothetical protein